MDRVGLGRALGYGTRHAAKTLAAVAEAAAANPASGVSGASPERASGARGREATSPLRRVEPVVAGARVAGRSVWGSLATFSSALWLRVTGLFFGLIAFAMGSGAWRLRGVVRGGGESAGHFWLFAGFAGLFAYFAVSGFVRASLRERRE